MPSADPRHKVRIKTKGLSDVYVTRNAIDPGGQSGWRTHPGPSLIIVTLGEITAYEGDDSHCRPTRYRAGEGFVDEGGEHVHVLRNETNAPAETVAVQFLPKDATRRIDAPDPGNCPSSGAAPIFPRGAERDPRERPLGSDRQVESSGGSGNWHTDSSKIQRVT